MSTPLVWGCQQLPVIDPIQTESYVNNYSLEYSQYLSQENLSPEWDPGPFVNPTADNAWWISESLPELNDVAGAVICRIDGLHGNAPFTRESQRLAYPQSGTQVAWKKAKRATRKLEITAIVYGKSCCATSRWVQALSVKLRGCCSNDCGGGCLRLLEYTSNNSGQCSDIAACRKWIQFNNVALTEGPELLFAEEALCGCGCQATQPIKFTLEAGDPFMYLDPVEIANITLSSSTGVCRLGNDFFQCTTCEEVDTSDPTCTVLPPPALTDVDACFCPPPLEQTQCFAINLPNDVFTANLGIRIQTNSNSISPLGVFLWQQNPVYPINDPYYDLCNICTGFYVSYIDSSSIFEVSPYGAVQITKPGNIVVNAKNRLYTAGRAPHGGVINIDKCKDYYLCITAPAGIDLSGVEITITATTVMP